MSAPFNWDDLLITVVAPDTYQIVEDEHAYSLKAEQRMIVFEGERGENGTDGKDGDTINPVGEWVDGREYARMDLATYRGSSYLAVQDVPMGVLITDTQYWQLIAQRGTATIWGEIQGDITNQNDLQTSLNAKVDASDLGTMAEVDDAPSDGYEYVRKNGSWKVSSGGGGGAGIWGYIEGNIADQEDLQDALDEKADTSDLGTMAAANDVPSDSKTYGRKNGSWSEIVLDDVSWGNIDGDIADQEDLQDALDEKASAIVTLVPHTVSGVVVEIQPDVSITSLKSTYPVTQSGSGTPSASNIRPFVAAQNYIGFGRASAVSGGLYETMGMGLPCEIYGGIVDPIAGIVTLTHGHIASYNGETLNGVWYSDRDVQSSGVYSPTIGAEVVYELKNPVHVRMTKYDPPLVQLWNPNYCWVFFDTQVRIEQATQSFEVTYTTSEVGVVDTKSYIDAQDALKANISDLGHMAYEDDAPSDNAEYVRMNGSWIASSGTPYVEATYYVNPSSGSDSNDGSSGHPFATVQHAIDRASNIGSTNIVVLSSVTENLTIKQKTIVLDMLSNGSTITGNITIQNNAYLKNESNYGIGVVGVVYVQDNSEFVQSDHPLTITGAILVRDSHVSVNDITITNSAVYGRGIYATGASQVSIDTANITATDGLLAYDGAVMYVGELTGTMTTEARVSSGGHIFIGAKALSLGAMAEIDDAPSDGNEYVRKNGQWRVSSGGGGGGGGTVYWGDIEGTLSTQNDLQTALDAKADTADLGSLATQDTVDYATEVTNKPTLGALAAKDKTDWDTDIDGIPSTFTPSSHTHDTRYYTKTTMDSLLGDKANTSMLGDLAYEDTVDYSDVTNTPSLGTMSAVNDAPSDGKEYARKNGTWTEVTGGGGGTPEWGDITGTLSDQTDLQSALDAKTDLSVIAPAFSASESYTGGDFVVYDGKLYCFVSTHHGAWSPSNAYEVKVSGVLGAKPNDAPSDGKTYGRKNGNWTEVTGGGGGSTDWDDITNKPSSFPPEAHNHDDRYYTESEIDGLLADKADTADLGDLATQDTVDWTSDIDNIPSAFPPSAHTHDDRYYTESETDTLLGAKADTSSLGDLAYEDAVDYSDIQNAPTLGSLAAKNTADYATDVTNKPTLGTMASVNDAPSDGSEYVRKNGAWAVSSGGGGGGGTWGSITGTLSDQTDLQDALDLKQNALTFDNAPTASSTNPVTSDGVYSAIHGRALHISMASTSSLGTITNAAITTTMRVVGIVWGTPANVTSNVTWNTDTAGQLVLSGTLSGATTAEIDLIDFG